MTPHDSAASNGPIHTAATGLQLRLRDIFPEVRFQHELLPAPLDTKMLGALAMVRTPLVGLAWLGLKPAVNSGRVLDAEIRWGLYLVTRNPKSGPRLLGDSLGPGLAQMVHAAILGLQGWIVAGARDAGVGPFAIGDAETTDGKAWEREELACAALTISTRASFTAVLPDQLKTLAAVWTFDGDAIAATDTFQGNKE